MNRFIARQTCLLFILILCVLFIAGCGGGGEGAGETGHWLPGNSDTTAPRVTAVVPLNKATGVARNLKKVTAAFSEAMDSATLTTASFTLACPAGTPVTGGGAVTYVAASRVATLPLPTATNLPASTVCTATVTTGAKDLAGNPLAANYTWTFTTGLLVDITAPTVTLTVPADAATGVARNTKITATFNEDMDPETINTTTFTVSGVTGTVAYAVAGKMATFTPTTPATLAASTAYTAKITTGATDLAGNALAAGSKPNPWTFTTGASTDSTAPTVTLVNPVDLSTTVCNNKTISATFSEAMDPLTITTATFTLANTLTPGTHIVGVVLYDATSQIATFNPDANLPAGLIKYTATVKGGAGGVEDVAGTVMAVDKVWSFTTDNTNCVAKPALGRADTFGIASTAGVSNTGATTVKGDVVLDPLAECNTVTVGSAGLIGACGGFPPTITGTVVSPLYPDAGVTSGNVKADLRQTYIDISPGSLGGATAIAAGTTLGEPTGSALVLGDNLFYQGVYKSITTIMITGDLTLDAQGDPNAVFVFQSAGTIGIAAGAAPPGVRSRILLVNGAKASNVFWQAGGAATLMTYSEFQGNILAYSSITMQTGAISCGRLFAGASTDGAFVFDSNVVSVPGQPFVPPDGYSTTCQ
jgi:hypothetical protein